VTSCSALTLVHKHQKKKNRLGHRAFASTPKNARNRSLGSITRLVASEDALHEVSDCLWCACVRVRVWDFGIEVPSPICGFAQSLVARKQPISFTQTSSCNKVPYSYFPFLLPFGPWLLLRAIFPALSNFFSSWLRHLLYRRGSRVVFVCCLLLTATVCYLELSYVDLSFNETSSNMLQRRSANEVTCISVREHAFLAFGVGVTFLVFAAIERNAKPHKFRAGMIWLGAQWLAAIVHPLPWRCSFLFFRSKQAALLIVYSTYAHIGPPGWRRATGSRAITRLHSHPGATGKHRAPPTGGGGAGARGGPPTRSQSAAAALA
jgi:hypothetical protein